MSYIAEWVYHKKNYIVFWIIKNLWLKKNKKCVYYIKQRSNVTYFNFYNKINKCVMYVEKLKIFKLSNIT